MAKRTLNQILHGGGKGVLAQTFRSLELDYESFDKTLTEKLARGKLKLDEDEGTEKLRVRHEEFFPYHGNTSFTSLAEQFAYLTDWAEDAVEKGGYAASHIVSMLYDHEGPEEEETYRPAGYWITFVADEAEDDYASRMALREQALTLLSYEERLKEAAAFVMEQKDVQARESKREAIEKRIAALQAERDAL